MPKTEAAPAAGAEAASAAGAKAPTPMPERALRTRPYPFIEHAASVSSDGKRIASPFYRMLKKRLNELKSTLGPALKKKGLEGEDLYLNFASVQGLDPWMLEGFMPLHPDMDINETADQLAATLYGIEGKPTPETEARYNAFHAAAIEHFSRIRGIDMVHGQSLGTPKRWGELHYLCRENMELWQTALGKRYAETLGQPIKASRMRAWEKMECVPESADIVNASNNVFGLRTRTAKAFLETYNQEKAQALNAHRAAAKKARVALQNPEVRARWRSRQIAAYFDSMQPRATEALGHPESLRFGQYLWALRITARVTVPVMVERINAYLSTLDPPSPPLKNTKSYQHYENSNPICLPPPDTLDGILLALNPAEKYRATLKEKYQPAAEKSLTAPTRAKQSKYPADLSEVYDFASMLQYGMRKNKWGDGKLAKELSEKTGETIKPCKIQHWRERRTPPPKDEMLDALAGLLFDEEKEQEILCEHAKSFVLTPHAGHPATLSEIRNFPDCVKYGLRKRQMTALELAELMSFDTETKVTKKQVSFWSDGTVRPPTGELLESMVDILTDNEKERQIFEQYAASGRSTPASRSSKGRSGRYPG